MLVKVKAKDFHILRELEVETYGDTFGPYIVEEDLEDYFSTVLSLEQIEKQTRNQRPILSLITIRKFVVSSSLTGARHKRSQ